MDDKSFDRLVRLIGAGASRRSILKGFLGLGGAAMVRAGPPQVAARDQGSRPDPPILDPPSATTTQAPVATTPPPDPCAGFTTTCARDGCCNGACTAEGRCCPTGLSICGEDCCATAAQCCGGECCPAGTVCVGEEVCCLSSLFCPTNPETPCCAQGQVCCGGQCCGAPNSCLGNVCVAPTTPPPTTAPPTTPAPTTTPPTTTTLAPTTTTAAPIPTTTAPTTTTTVAPTTTSQVPTTITSTTTQPTTPSPSTTAAPTTTTACPAGILTCGPTAAGVTSCCTPGRYDICCAGPEFECCGTDTAAGVIRECDTFGHCCEVGIPYHCAQSGPGQTGCCATPCVDEMCVVNPTTTSTTTSPTTTTEPTTTTAQPTTTTEAATTTTTTTTTAEPTTTTAFPPFCSPDLSICEQPADCCSNCCRPGGFGSQFSFCIPAFICFPPATTTTTTTTAAPTTTTIPACSPVGTLFCAFPPEEGEGLAPPCCPPAVCINNQCFPGCSPQGGFCNIEEHCCEDVDCIAIGICECIDPAVVSVGCASNEQCCSGCCVGFTDQTSGTCSPSEACATTTTTAPPDGTTTTTAAPATTTTMAPTTTTVAPTTTTTTPAPTTTTSEPTTTTTSGPVICPPYTIQAGNACIFPCSTQPCAACTTGFVQCVSNPDGSHICASNLETQLNSGNCPETGCASGFSCYANAVGTFNCFRISASRFCTTTEAPTTTTTPQPATTTTTPGPPCTSPIDCGGCRTCSAGSCVPNHDFCTGCLDCDGGTGQCVANVANCTSAPVCTGVTCLETGSCSHFTLPNTTSCLDGKGQCDGNGACVCWCESGGQCSAPGQVNPANACQTCNVPGGWQTALCRGCFECDGATGQCVPNDANCTDIRECRDAFCLEGNCLYVPNNANCDDGNECTAGVCSINGICSHSNLSGTSCLDGRGQCVAGTCVCACVSGGQCFAHGAANPANGCQICNVAFGWLPVLCPAVQCQVSIGCENGQCRYVPDDEGASCDVIQAIQCQIHTGACSEGACVSTGFVNSPNGSSCLGCGDHPTCGTCECLSGVCVRVEHPNSHGTICGTDLGECTDQVCQFGACVTVPVNEGVECGAQPDDTCRQTVCRNGVCTQEYAGPNGADCSAPGVPPCNRPRCSSFFARCIEFLPVVCPSHTNCEDVRCNPETGVCDVYIAPESGTKECGLAGSCCPSQVCASAEPCNPFNLVFYCYDPEDAPVCEI